MYLNSAFSSEFMQRLKAVATEQGLSLGVVLDEWVNDVRQRTPIDEWQRNAQVVLDRRQTALFAPTVPPADVRVLMALAFLSSVTSKSASQLIEYEQSSEPQTFTLSPKIDRGELSDTFDTVQVMLEEAVARGKWEEETLNVEELKQTITQFFELVRRLLLNTADR